VLTARFGEDKIVNQNNKTDFSFAEHMLDTNLKSESTTKTLDTFHVTSHGKCRKITERFYIRDISGCCQLLRDTRAPKCDRKD
jgi:hypothetical protein